MTYPKSHSLLLSWMTAWLTLCLLSTHTLSSSSGVLHILQDPSPPEWLLRHFSLPWLFFSGLHNPLSAVHAILDLCLCKENEGISNSEALDRSSLSSGWSPQFSLWDARFRPFSATVLRSSHLICHDSVHALPTLFYFKNSNFFSPFSCSTSSEF